MGAMEYERTHAAAMITEKRGRNFDKVVGEWKAKADDLMAELDACNSECRNFNAERFRLKAALDEATEQLDIVRRENKNLADEIKDLLDQLGDGGRSIHELDKQRRRLEAEKEELQAALEEAEGALEAEENKVLRAQLELGQVKQEIDRRISEKEEEFNNTRKNHGRAMESLQASLESEQRAKAEGLKSIKRYQGQLREAETQYEEACRARQEMAEKASLADRRANALQGEVEESRALLDSADRGKRQTEAELGDARNAVNEMASINSRANSDKRRVEGALHTMQAEIDDLLHQAKNSEEKAKKAMVDAARLADELRSEQDHTTTLTQGKRAMESQLAELENRIRELEIELGNVQARTGENMKAHQKADRKI